jgi:acyl carrier protein
MSADAFAALAAILRRLCQHPLPDLAPETLLLDIPDLDSIRLLEAVALLEEELRVEIDTAMLDGLECVGDILRAVATARPMR